MAGLPDFGGGGYAIPFYNATLLGSKLASGGGLFGGNNYNMSGLNDLISQREAQIDDFSKQLTLARNNVLTNYQNLQSNTMNRFMGDYNSYLGARGLSANGGAFGSGVGREATSLQGQYDSMNSNMTQQDFNMVGQLQSQLFGQNFGAALNAANMNYQNRMQQGQAFGTLAGMGLGMAMGGPMGGAAGGRLAGGIFSSGSSPFGSSYNSFGNPGSLNLPMSPMGGGWGNGMNLSSDVSSSNWMLRNRLGMN